MTDPTPDLSNLTNLKTIAVLITEDTYSLAVACLPEEFRRTHPPKTYGNYLIINQKYTVYASGLPIENKIENTVVDGDYLKDWYVSYDMLMPIPFIEIIPKADDFNMKIRKANDE